MNIISNSEEDNPMTSLRYPIILRPDYRSFQVPILKKAPFDKRVDVIAFMSSVWGIAILAGYGGGRIPQVLKNPMENMLILESG
jgi:hypothetical protein